LGEWTEEEYFVLDQKMKIINEMVLSFCFAGIENTMNEFNNK
jgi:PTH1 family peptidyl-tRNA hydrolase